MQRCRWTTHFAALLLFFGIQVARAQSANQANDLTDQSLEDLMDVHVVSAALHDQNLTDAPGDVTVITAEQIRRWGWRSLADALAYVRGFFATSDHTYTYLGIRGFSLPGDYGTRTIVMINGHNLADNIFESSTWLGDFPVDISLIDRIEIVRGPSSALYGSNGILATINVVTKRPNRVDGTEVRTETDSLRERKGQVSTSIPLGETGHFLFSTSVFNNAGAHDLYFSQFDAPQTNFGHAIDMDGEKGYHVFADVTWGDWELLAVTDDRVKIQPISWGDTIFNDRGTREEDSRGFIDLSYSKDLQGGRTLSWRGFYDDYRCRGIYHYPSDQGVLDNRERDYGDWIGSKLTYRLPDAADGYLTVGGEVRFDLRALQNVYNITPARQEILWINHPDRYVATFAQQEWKLSRNWELNAGARLDWSWLKGTSVSPRAAAVYKPSETTVLKLMYGRGFRNPNAFEMFWADNGLTQKANLSLRPEIADTYELDVERRFSKRIRSSLSAYHYQMDHFIQQIYGPDGLMQYVNTNHIRANGVSIELECDLPSDFQLISSLELQRSMFGGGLVLPNSPGQVGKIQVSRAVWRNRFVLGGGIQALGQRQTYDGVTVPSVILPDMTVSSSRTQSGLAISAGIKNVTNSFYRDPAGLTGTVDSVIGNGRAYYVSLSWQSSHDRESALPQRQSRATVNN